MQKQEKRREMRLKRFWRSSKTPLAVGEVENPKCFQSTNDIQRYNRNLRFNGRGQTTSNSDGSTSDGGGASGGGGGGSGNGGRPACTLPLLQVWPSQSLMQRKGFVHLRRNSDPKDLRDSPRGEADGQSFIFPVIAETNVSGGSHTDNDHDNRMARTLGDLRESGGGGGGDSSSGRGSAGDKDNARHRTNGISDSLFTQRRRNSLYCDSLHAGDSGIDSVQASPSPNAIPPPSCSILLGDLTAHGKNSLHGRTDDSGGIGPAGGGSAATSLTTTPTLGSPQLSFSHGHGPRGRNDPINSFALNYRRKSSTLLHPDDARLVALSRKHAAAFERSQTSPDQTSIEDAAEFQDKSLSNNLRLCSASSSTTSSLTSVAAVNLHGPTPASGSGTAAGCVRSVMGHRCSPRASIGDVTALQGVSDSWLQIQSDRERDPGHDRRRSSTMTARYSLFDALDLEYALLRAAARGSVGPYSLNESIHKLTFTQSLAFPALARGLATKRRRSTTRTSSRPLNPNESGLNTCAKVITAILLVSISFMVFLIVYKFVRT